MKKFKELKIKFLQSLSDIILVRMSKASTKTDAELWFDFGMRLNGWCVNRDIYLN